jgi:hypothetical protein
MVKVLAHIVQGKGLQRGLVGHRQDENLAVTRQGNRGEQIVFPKYKTHKMKFKALFGKEVFQTDGRLIL